MLTPRGVTRNPIRSAICNPVRDAAHNGICNSVRSAVRNVVRGVKFQSRGWPKVDLSKTESMMKQMEARGTKTLFVEGPRRQESWLFWLFVRLMRVVALTIFWMGIGMGAGLFVGILYMIGLSVFTHSDVRMALAYRSIATPIAVATGVVALAWNLVRAVQAIGMRRRELAASSRP